MSLELPDVLKALAAFGEQVKSDFREQIYSLHRRVEAALKAAAEPAPVWESIKVAMESRHYGRKALMAAVNDGRLASRRVPTFGGKLGVDLSVVDLDRHFPRRNTKQKATA